MPETKMGTASVKSIPIPFEGVWSLLRSWLCPHRGISKEQLPFYLAFFEFIHNVRQRGKALFPSLLQLIL